MMNATQCDTNRLHQPPRCGALLVLTDCRPSQQVFGLLLAAIVHDIAHPGVTNDFLVKTDDPLAAAHGSTSVNERHHLAAAFSIMANEDTNVLVGLTPAEQEQVCSPPLSLAVSRESKPCGVQVFPIPRPACPALQQHISIAGTGFMSNLGRLVCWVAGA